MRASVFFVAVALGLSAPAAAAPTLDVASPLDDTVVRPVVHLDATCDAGGGAPCTTITLVEQIDGCEVHTQIMRWYGATHVSFDLAIDDGAFADLELHATDAVGNAAVVTRRVYGDTSPALHELATVDGPIYDADASRVLYEAGGSSWILDRAACTRTLVGAGSAQALTPHGALVATCSGGCTLTELRDGALIARGPFDPSSLRIAGGFAVWTEGYVPGPLHRLDLASGDDRVIAADATPASGAVGPDGTVTYSNLADGGAHVAHRWTPAGDVALGPGDLSATDGALAVFTDDDAPACATRLYANGATEELSPLCTSPAYLATVRAGWVAYVRPDADGARQLWTRSPDGTRTQLTTTGCDLAPPLADDGAALARTTVDGDAAIYLVAPGAAPRAITHSDPIVMRNTDGTWLVAIGRTLFTLDADLAAAAAAAVCPAPSATPPITAPLAHPAAASDAAPAAGCSASGAGSPWLAALAILLLLRRRSRVTIAACGPRPSSR